MTSKTVQDSHPLSNHIDSPPTSGVLSPAISTSSTSGKCTMNGPTCHNEASSHQRLQVAAAPSASTSTVGLASGVERSTVGSNLKDFHGNPNMSCHVKALTNIPITKHLRHSNRDPSATSLGSSKVGKQSHNNGGSSGSEGSSSSLYHVSFHGLGKDSFRLTNSDRTGFVDLAAVAAAAASNSNGSGSSTSSMCSSSSSSVASEGGGGGRLFNNHNGPSLPPKSSRHDGNSLVLRSGTAANLRHRPYSVNHKAATKS